MLSQSRSRKSRPKKEALDPDANYTEDKGDFEIPTDEPDEETWTKRIPNPSDFKAAFAAGLRPKAPATGQEQDSLSSSIFLN